MHPRPDLNSGPDDDPALGAHRAGPGAEPGTTTAAGASPRPQEAAEPLIALVGSANSGKTTLFNLLTGSHYNTVNYPGATVEFALGQGKGLGFKCRVMDTPGLTSLIPASLDEKVTVDALFTLHRPDLVLAVVDANQISRHLYLVKQMQDLGFRLVIALTMSDLLGRRGLSIDPRKLSEMMDCPVVALDPRRKEGLAGLGARLAEELAPKGGAPGRGGPDIQAYREFAAGMNDERVGQTYAALDLIETMVLRDPGPTAAEAGADARAGGEAGAANTGTAVAAGGEDAGRSARARSDAADRFLLHPVWGLGIFLFAMFAIFTSIFWLATPFMDGIDSAFGWAIETLQRTLPGSWITDLIAEGVIGGIGAVVIFLPQILILFFAMGYLEDSGYLARGAALVDKPLSKIGLNGKSFVPLLSGYACAIPAMLAARTIPNRYERYLTIFIIPLMSCSARLPVYTLLLAFLTPRDKPWLGGLALTGLYLAGLVLGAAVSTLVSKLIRNREASGFILELPALRRPLLKVVAASTYHKAQQYLRKAGLTIVSISVGLWVLTHTPHQAQRAHQPAGPDAAMVSAPAEGAEDGGSEYVAVSHSYAAQLGRFLEPVTRPMGLDWRGGVAMICGFAAREVFVSAMALMYRVEEDGGAGDGVADRLLARMSDVRFEDTGERIFTVSTVLGIILFFMIALQCVSTVAVAKSEFGGWKLAAIQLSVYTGVAYLLTVALVQGLRALGVA